MRIVLEEDYPRAPQIMHFVQHNLIGILGDMAVQDWRCSDCDHDWRTVEDFSPSDYTIEDGALKRKDGRPLEPHLLAKDEPD